jgi:hypothetical protein
MGGFIILLKRPDPCLDMGGYMQQARCQMYFEQPTPPTGKGNSINPASKQRLDSDTRMEEHVLLGSMN